MILRTSMHTGKLAALDFNFFQPNLLASAGNHSEVKSFLFFIMYHLN